MKWLFAIIKGLVFANLVWMTALEVSAQDRDSDIKPTGTAILADPNRFVAQDRIIPQGRLDDGSIALFVPASVDIGPDRFFSRFDRRLGLGRQDEMVEADRGASLIFTKACTGARHRPPWKPMITVACTTITASRISGFTCSQMAIPVSTAISMSMTLSA
jgi:hypothetical protein